MSSSPSPTPNANGPNASAKQLVPSVAPAKKGFLTASRLRLLLIALMVLTVLLLVGGFVFAQQALTGFAGQISQLNADAETGTQNLSVLRAIERQLEEDETLIAKTRSIVAESQQYQYQDQIVNDISAIGRASNVAITQFDFGSSTAATDPNAALTPTAPVPSGLKSQKVTISIKSPLSYDRLMGFIRAIESNSLKMQIANVTIARSGRVVSSQTFVIEVYTR